MQSTNVKSPSRRAGAALLALSATLAGALALDADARLAWRGPPTICFPIEIGDARTIPSENDAAARKSDRPLEAAIGDVLTASDDALVHMETLRRAFYLVEEKGARVALLATLKDRVLAAEIDEKVGAKRRALAWFDLAYWLRVLEQGQGHERGAAFPYLDKALRICGDDAGLRFGAAVVDFDSGERMARYYDDVAAAHRLATDHQGLVARNLALMVSRFTPALAADGYDKIGEHATAKAKT